MSVANNVIWFMYTYPNCQQESTITKLKRALILNHRDIRVAPYLPRAWLDRAGTFLRLGFAELAVADAHKALLLSESALYLDLIGKAPSADLAKEVLNSVALDIDVKIDSSDNARKEPFHQYLKLCERMAYLTVAQGLFCIRAWHDAIKILKIASTLFPAYKEFTKVETMNRYFLDNLKTKKKHQGHGEGTVEMSSKRGRVANVCYPWVAAEEVTRTNEAVHRAKARFQAASKNAIVARSHIAHWPGSLGVFAVRDIAKGERILLEKSIYSTFNTPKKNTCRACGDVLSGAGVTINCCQDAFCSGSCRQEALATYHPVLCGKDFTWLYEHCAKLDPNLNTLIPLLMVKILATAVHQNISPLKVAAVETLMANPNPEIHSFYRINDNLIEPTKVLSGLGVDIFTDHRFDSWAIQSLFLKIENNGHGSSVGWLQGCGVDPLYSMFNHSCNPAAERHGLTGFAGLSQIR